MSWASHQGLVFASFMSWGSCTCLPGESGSSCSGLWGLLCQKSCPLTAAVSLHEQTAHKDGLGHWQAVSGCWAGRLYLLCLWLLGSFLPLMLLRNTFLHIACQFRMRSMCEGDVTSVTAQCLQSLFPTHSPVLYNSPNVMSAPCSIPHEVLLREVKIMV